jgi:ethanolamine utilization protein EutN
MRIAKVVGVIVATVKDRRLEGSKCLLVATIDPAGNAQGAPYVAMDMVGAGEGEMVLIVEGSSARIAAGDPNRPVDAVIVGILDSIRHNGQLFDAKND